MCRTSASNSRPFPGWQKINPLLAQQPSEAKQGQLERMETAHPYSI